MPIQAVPSLCSRCTPEGSMMLRSNTPMLSRPEEPAAEDVVAFGVLAVHPPREVQQHLLEHALEEVAIALAGGVALDVEDAPARPTRGQEG